MKEMAAASTKTVRELLHKLLYHSSSSIAGTSAAPLLAVVEVVMLVYHLTRPVRLAM